MTDGEALRRAIVAEPDDDTPRLVYADWLEENARPDRAAFIRHQVEAARADPLPARAAAARADALLGENRAEWAKHVGPKVLRAEFTRGFVGRVVVDVGRFREVAPPLFAAEPIQAVGLVRFSPNFGRESLAAAFDAPEMGRVRELSLPEGAFGVSQAEFDALADAPRLVNLEHLTLRGNGLFPAWLSRLMTAKGLPNLTGLTLVEMPHLGPGLRDAAEAAGHRRLKRLELDGVAFEILHLQKLLGSKCLSKLEELTVRPPPRGLNTMSQLDLGWALPWATLRKLDLGGQWLGANGVHDFVRLPECKGLRWLGLSDNRLRSAGVRVLVESKHLHLNYLDVRDNDLDDGDLASLRARFPAALVEG